MRGTVLKATDPVIENFLHAGLVPLGRSSTPEFGLTFDTLTKYDGEVTVTRNPWNLERTSGGSSGGSGVAAATGIVPLSNVFGWRRLDSLSGGVLRPRWSEG